MAGEAQDNVWPLPSFYFKVEFCLLYTSDAADE